MLYLFNVFETLMSLNDLKVLKKHNICNHFFSNKIKNLNIKSLFFSYISQEYFFIIKD